MRSGRDSARGSDTSDIRDGTTTEVGCQPFSVYGMLRTADSISPVALPAVATSLAAFVRVYFIVFGAGLVYILSPMRRPPSAGKTGLCAHAWFLLSYVGLGISIWPMIVPPSISISNWDTAAPSASQLFLLVGAAILIPLILSYTSFSYWTFRGKVRPGENYQ